MIDLTSIRVKGSGKGNQIGFPTINFSLEKLPDGLSIGLWAVVDRNKSQGLSLISKADYGFRIETHMLVNRVYQIEIGHYLYLTYINKVREVGPISIDSDIKLVKDYFSGIRTCDMCHCFYSQDYGYSNYTVEGTKFGCFANKFDDENNNSIIYSAAKCDIFISGDMWEFDVDGEVERPTDEYIKAMVREVKINKILK